MTEFGKQLREFRHQCNDPKSPQGKLTQETFGELVGRELGISYTGAAVSDWERGKSKIHADDRPVLMALINVLHQYGGIKTEQEASWLLKAGNYRDLDPTETQKIFASAIEDAARQQPIPGQNTSHSVIPFLLGNLFSIPDDELQKLITKAEEGPSPSWPRKLAVLMRKASERWSISISSVFWMAIWALAWWLIIPSLRWPFKDQDSAYSAIVMYVGGTLAVPLLIGLLIPTKDSEYWKQQGLANSKILRLYTYQGAGIGFNLGYFFVFPFALVGYYLQLGSSVWLEFAAVTLGLLVGNMAARVVPHNLWLAYGRLHPADGAIFFVVALLGPLWGLFFLEYYLILLTPLLGSIVIWVALILCIIIAARQSEKIDTEQASLKK